MSSIRSPRSRTTALAVGTGLSACALGAVPAALAAASSSSFTPPHAKPEAHLSVRRARHNVLAGGHVTVAGTLRPRAANRRVALQVRRGDGPWRGVANAQTRRGGAYRLRYTAGAIGAFQGRIVYEGGSDSRSTRTELGAVNVYHEVFVSHYGGGGTLACGGQLTAGTIGVANKTLPCGTKVHLRYHGRQMTVRVIDRGPYVAGRDFDLTDATHQALGTGDLTTIQATR